MPLYSETELEYIKSNFSEDYYLILKQRNDYIKEIFNTHSLPLEEAELIAIHRFKKMQDLPPKLKELLLGVKIEALNPSSKLYGKINLEQYPNSDNAITYPQGAVTLRGDQP